MSNQGGSSSQSGVLPKTQKSKRKISLPWFRQGSVAKSHPALTRQHTIDTPSSFQARLLRRQPSQSALVIVTFFIIIFIVILFACLKRFLIRSSSLSNDCEYQFFITMTFLEKFSCSLLLLNFYFFKLLFSLSISQ